MGAKLILEEYVKGTDPDRNDILRRTEEEQKMLENIVKKMTNYYQWSEHKSFLWMTSQNCSDMIIQIGKK